MLQWTQLHVTLKPILSQISILVIFNRITLVKPNLIPEVFFMLNTLRAKKNDMNPFNRERTKIHKVVLDPNGMRVFDSLVAQIQKINLTPRKGPQASSAPLSSPSSELPKYLDRGAPAEERRNARSRRYWMDHICKVETDEVEKIINVFLTDSITVSEAFDQTTALVSGGAALKLFESIYFDSKQAVVSEIIKAFWRKHQGLPHQSHLDIRSLNAKKLDSK